MRRWLAAALLVAMTAALLGVAPTPRPAALRFSLSDRLADLRVSEGQVTFRTPDGPVTVPAETFIRALEARQGDRAERGWFYRLFDITSPLGMVWVGIGLAGQVLFTGRMVVQWLASEKSRRSVVPPAFWWMSLVGATMLITYFTWRVDVVGILGQATGWGIYARNLWMIYHPHSHPHPDPSPLADPSPEPIDGPIEPEPTVGRAR